MNFNEWFATSLLASWLRVFAAVIISAAVADWATKGSIDLGAWQTWVIGGLVSTLPTLLRWLNPSDVEFGHGSPKDEWTNIWEKDEA